MNKKIDIKLKKEIKESRKTQNRRDDWCTDVC